METEKNTTEPISVVSKRNYPWAYIIIAFLLGIGIGYSISSSTIHPTKPVQEIQAEPTKIVTVTPQPTYMIVTGVPTSPPVTLPPQKTKRELDDEFYVCVSQPGQTTIAQECEAKVGNDPDVKQQCITERNTQINKDCTKQVYGT
jgi:hypothetical protein